MQYFEKYVSNTYAGSGNQHHFSTEGEVRTGRVFYKITAPGEYNYSILFSNIIDSTYADGSVSHKNLICHSWTIHRARIGKCRYIDSGEAVKSLTLADMDEGESADVTVFGLESVTFGGLDSKQVAPGEFFNTDPIRMRFEKGEYLCLELTFSGRMIPYHEETLLPVFVKEGDRWVYSKKMPIAGMVGCDRPVKARVAYIGDSITQGIGTPLNSYAHWNAVLSEMLGEEYSFWNLGLGYGRANDAATDGAWLYKAKQNDVVFVCFGVNDIFRIPSEDQIKADLTSIVDALLADGKRVILQTVPPFDYKGETVRKWESINEYVKTVLGDRVDALFDCVPYLGTADSPEAARFGGHPNAEGSAVWAKALYEAVSPFFGEQMSENSRADNP